MPSAPPFNAARPRSTSYTAWLASSTASSAPGSQRAGFVLQSRACRSRRSFRGSSFGDRISFGESLPNIPSSLTATSSSTHRGLSEIRTFFVLRSLGRLAFCTSSTSTTIPSSATLSSPTGSQRSGRVFQSRTCLSRRSFRGSSLGDRISFGESPAYMLSLSTRTSSVAHRGRSEIRTFFTRLWFGRCATLASSRSSAVPAPPSHGASSSSSSTMAVSGRSPNTPADSPRPGRAPKETYALAPGGGFSAASCCASACG